MREDLLPEPSTVEIWNAFSRLCLIFLVLNYITEPSLQHSGVWSICTKIDWMITVVDVGFLKVLLITPQKKENNGLV
jgi:hypothetical protein